MNYKEKRQLKKSGFELPILGHGCAPFTLSNDFFNNGIAAKVIRFSLQKGINHFDTAPWYGAGRSELRVGNTLREINRDNFIISTKVGRVLQKPLFPENAKLNRWPQEIKNNPWEFGLKFNIKFDYTYDGIMRSYEDSIQRLGFSKIDLLVIHDLDFHYHKTEENVQNFIKDLEINGGWKALEGLRASGEISAIGAGINQDKMIPYFIPKFDLDFFLVAMPYTLLKQNVLDYDFPLCEKMNVQVIIGAPYQSGILATGVDEKSTFELGSPVRATYNYKKPREEIILKVKKIQQICSNHNINIGSAALQFPLMHPSVVSVIPGMIAESHVSSNIENLKNEISTDLWLELKKEKIIREDSPIN